MTELAKAMQVTVRHNFPNLHAKVINLQKQNVYAMAVAMTRTMQQVRDAERAEMERVFDRPTRFTLNSLYLKPATKTSLEARVWVKDSERPTHFLLPQIYGGPRPQKRFEELLRQAGILSASERTVPGAGAELDAFGNMKRSQITRILSQLRAFSSAGFDANATGSRRSRAKRSLERYFVARKGESRVGGGSWKGGLKTQHLRSGIYVALQGSIKPVLIFVDGAQYLKRFDFQRIAQRVISANFERNFAIEFAKAKATARIER